jgi:hypothetical protein
MDMNWIVVGQNSAKRRTLVITLLNFQDLHLETTSFPKLLRQDAFGDW